MIAGRNRHNNNHDRCNNKNNAVAGKMCWSGEYYMLPISTYVRDYATEGSIPRRIWERKGGDGKMEGIEEEKMVGEMMVDEWW